MFSPLEVRQRAISWGEGKCALPILRMFVLGILAGAFIALGALASIFSNVYAGRFAGACIFACGLAMTVVMGAELFTGNSLLVMGALSKKVTMGSVLRNWVVVYIANLVGGLLIALIASYGGLFSNPDVASAVVSTAAGKANLPFSSALLKGILCNVLVCSAVMMNLSTKTTEGKALLVFLPVAAFVVSGTEHCVANMFYLPAGLFTSGIYGIEAAGLSVGTALLNNLLPVTIGNIIGGCLLGIAYWVGHRPAKEEA